MARPTVLIVEDEALVLEVAVSEFEDAGYDVLIASNAEAALALLRGNAPIDLLFTDIRIPGVVDGWDIAAQARSLRPQIPVIYATGYSGPATPQAVPGGLLFRKPYRLSEILTAAQRLI